MCPLLALDIVKKLCYQSSDDCIKMMQKITLSLKTEGSGHSLRAAYIGTVTVDILESKLSSMMREWFILGTLQILSNQKGWMVGKGKTIMQ